MKKYFVLVEVSSPQHSFSAGSFYDLEKAEKHAMYVKKTYRNIAGRGVFVSIVSLVKEVENEPH